MNEDWDKYVTQRHAELDRKLDQEKKRLSEKAEEDAYYKRAAQLLKVIDKGDLEKVKASLADLNWDGKSDKLIFYRRDKNANDTAALYPDWETMRTTLLTRAVEAKKMNIVSFVVMQPEFHTNNPALLGKIGAIAIEQGNYEVLQKVLSVREKIPHSHVVAAFKRAAEYEKSSR